MKSSSNTVAQATPAASKSDRARGTRSIKLLVVVDATEASTRVLEYVGQIGAACHGAELHLACISSHPPPELLETGGSEVPDREERIGAPDAAA